MTDYQGNSKKQTEGLGVPEKVIERAITTEVIIKKKSFGRKLRDIFVEADLKSSGRYVISEILIPAVRNMIVDGASRGVERMVYGSAATRPRQPGQGPLFTYPYNNPISRPYSGLPGRMAPPINVGPRVARQIQEDIILSTRAEGELLLERMTDAIDKYQFVSRGDLMDILGLHSSHTDQKWGWVYLGGAAVRQVKEGYLVDLPPAEPLQ
jgi:hypothetical protein